MRLTKHVSDRMDNAFELFDSANCVSVLKGDRSLLRILKQQTFLKVSYRFLVDGGKMHFRRGWTVAFKMAGRASCSSFQKDDCALFHTFNTQKVFTKSYWFKAFMLISFTSWTKRYISNGVGQSLRNFRQDQVRFSLQRWSRLVAHFKKKENPWFEVCISCTRCVKCISGWDGQCLLKHQTGLVVFFNLERWSHITAHIQQPLPSPQNHRSL